MEKPLVVIVANGEEPKEQQITAGIAEADFIIAADGGSSICYHLGITPQVIIGDLDSSRSDIAEIFAGSQIIRKHDQDSSDMEKALNYAVRLHPRRINIISSLGSRTDHLLENILIFYHFERYDPTGNIEICLYDNWGRIRFLQPGEHVIRNRTGRTVSFFCLGDLQDLTMHGFRYNVKHRDYKGYFGGLSNVYNEEECRISFKGNKLIWYECYE